MIANCIIFILISFFGNSVALHSNDTKIPIKIVSEYAKGESLGLGIEEISSLSNKENDRKFTIKPAPFSGPQQFKKLKGLCFSYLDDKYKYQFCPFDNVTQEEIEATHEPFKGILGVWGEWIIINNTFNTMHMLEGAKCGSGLGRNTKIYIKCGNAHTLTSFSEPAKCYYKGLFHTPLACGDNAMLVYPRLPIDLQREWDEIETEKFNDILTQKGYDEELKRLFLKAKYLLTEEERESLTDQDTNQESKCEIVKTSLGKRLKVLEKQVLEKDAIIRNLTKPFT